MELGYISAVEFSRSALYPEKLGVFRVEMKSTKHLNKAGGSSFGFSLRVADATRHLPAASVNPFFMPVHSE